MPINEQNNSLKKAPFSRPYGEKSEPQVFELSFNNESNRRIWGLLAKKTADRLNMPICFKRVGGHYNSGDLEYYSHQEMVRIRKMPS